jgi:hypothetical protein
MSTVVSAIVPLLSVLLGALLTYWLNVRGRWHSLVETLFNDAIAAAAVADASKYFLSSVGRPGHVSDDQYTDLLAKMNRDAVSNHTKRLGEAREAIARVTPYEPDLARYYRDAESLTTEPDVVLRALAEARARHV